LFLFNHVYHKSSIPILKAHGILNDLWQPVCPCPQAGGDRQGSLLIRALASFWTFGSGVYK